MIDFFMIFITYLLALQFCLEKYIELYVSTLFMDFQDKLSEHVFLFMLNCRKFIKQVSPIDFPGANTSLNTACAYFCYLKVEPSKSVLSSKYFCKLFCILVEQITAMQWKAMKSWNNANYSNE